MDRDFPQGLLISIVGRGSETKEIIGHELFSLLLHSFL